MNECIPCPATRLFISSKPILTIFTLKFSEVAPVLKKIRSLVFIVFSCVFQEEDTNRGRGKKKPLGDTNWFCPVALKENFVLYPGNPEIAARYREKTYYFSTTEARDKFLATPEEFLTKNESPKVIFIFFYIFIYLEMYHQYNVKAASL